MANPNGCWTYLLNGGPAESGVRGADPFGPPGPPRIWGVNGGFAGWSRSRGTEAAGLDIKAGDVYAHTLGPGVAFRWTSPLSDTIDITGGVWALRNVGRSTEWHIRINGKTLASGILSGRTQTRAHPNQIDLHQLVKVGDAVEFSVVPHKGTDDYVGVNFKITPRTRSPVVR